MAKPQNKLDQERFEKPKDAEVERGRDTEEARDVAAREVKELRRRESAPRKMLPEQPLATRGKSRKGLRRARG